MRLLSRFAGNEAGEVAIEYGLIAALICVAILTAMAGVHDAVSNTWALVDTKVTAANVKAN